MNEKKTMTILFILINSISFGAKQMLNDVINIKLLTLKSLYFLAQTITFHSIY